jgi:hypothetical protein
MEGWRSGVVVDEAILPYEQLAQVFGERRGAIHVNNVFDVNAFFPDYLG